MASNCSECGTALSRSARSLFCAACRKKQQAARHKRWAQEPRTADARRRYQRDWRDRGGRELMRARLYGITVEEMTVLLAGGCGVCGTMDDLCIDHSKETGKVRGCLCRRCNRSIGQLGDTAECVQRAADYLWAAV